MMNEDKQVKDVLARLDNAKCATSLGWYGFKKCTEFATHTVVVGAYVEYFCEACAAEFEVSHWNGTKVYDELLPIHPVVHRISVRDVSKKII